LFLVLMYEDYLETSFSQILNVQQYKWAARAAEVEGESVTGLERTITKMVIHAERSGKRN